MTQGSITNKLLRFFFPVLLGMLFQQLYNTVDAIIVGNCVGPAALAAVGGSPAVIINLVIGFFTGLASGATVIISQFFGSHDEEQLSRAEHTVITFCVLIGLVLTALGWFSAEWSLRLVKTPADILEDSRRYLQIYYMGTVPLLLFNVGSGILRAIGDSRWPLLFLGVCCVLNVFLDLLFVVAFSWGVAGVGWATVLSLMVSAVCVLLHLMHLRNACRLEVRKLGIHLPSLRRILFIGIPSGVQSAMYSLSNVIIQSSVNAFGTTVVAAWTAIGKFDGLYWVTSNSFGMTICTFVGQCYGAGLLDRMKEGIRKWLLVAVLSSAGISALLLGFARWGLRLFTSDAAVLNEAIHLLWFFAPFYVVWAFIEILSNAMRGAGDSITPMLICLVGVCLLRIAWIVIAVPFWNSIAAVSLSYPITWCITALAFIWYYRRGAWMKHGLAVQHT